MGAEEVLIWLPRYGDDLNTSDDVRESECTCAIREERVLGSEHLPLCKWCEELVAHPYWSRLWIVQEAVLGKVRTVWCGSKTIRNWEQMSDYMWKKQGHLNTLLHNVQANHRTWSLNYVLRAWGGNRCQDPRDKILGLQAIVAYEERVEIDYTKTAEQVFIDAVAIVLVGGWWDSHGTEYLATLAQDMGVHAWLGVKDKPLKPYAVLARLRWQKGLDLDLFKESVALGLSYLLHGETHLVEQWIETQQSAMMITASEWRVLLEKSPM